jgi:glycosyltransferase involved in cell wall biosynthesis
LVESGWEVTMFTAAYDGSVAEETIRGVRVVRAGGRYTVYPRAALAYLTGRLGKPDVLIDVHNGFPFFARIWTRRPVVVLLHHLHREQWPMVFGPLRARLGWWIESRLSVIVHRSCTYLTVSNASRNALIACGIDEERVAVVQNGVDDSLSGSVPPESATPIIAALGRLVPHKRIEHLIDAVAVLRHELPSLRLEVAGVGYRLEDLQAYALAEGMSDRVVFHGYVDEVTKRDLLARAWVLGLPSIREGWGLVIMEAAVLGTPAVAYRAAGGTADAIVDGVTGLLADSQPDLVESIGRIIQDEGLRRRLGEAARERALAYSWDSTVAGIEKLLLENLEGFPSAGRKPRAAGRRRPGMGPDSGPGRSWR